MDSGRLEKMLEGTISVVYLDVTVSTSDVARALVAEGGPVPFVVVAGEQTGGRGRRGHAFSSPRGGLYLTLAVPTSPFERDRGLLTSVVALAVCEVLEETFALGPGIKWVNDVYLEDRKLCGILIEGVQSSDGDGVALIGVGMNCLTLPTFVSDVRPAALCEVLGRECIDLESLCANVVRGIMSATSKEIDAHGVISKVSDRSVLLGRRVAFDREGTRVEGIARTIDGQGRLVVDLGGTTCRLDSAACNVRLT